MPNPTLPSITDATASALSNTVHDATGTRHIQDGIDDQDTPQLFTRLKQFEKHCLDLLGRMGGACVNIESGLNVGVFALGYMIGSTKYAYAGDASFALTASATNYLYLDTDATLKVSASAWPAGDHFKIAEVVTSGTDVTSILECRWMNFLVGVVNNWWTNLPTGTVDLNDQELKRVGHLWLSTPTELTLSSSGNINPSRTFHTVDTYADAATDDLEKINDGVMHATVYAGKLLILRAADASRTVIVKHANNISLWGEVDRPLDDIVKVVVLLDRGNGYQQIGGALPVVTKLEEDLDANDKTISNVGRLRRSDPTTLTISSGAITVTQDVHTILNEGAAATDDLDTIDGGVDGQFLLLHPAIGSQVVTLKSGSYRLASGDDYLMDSVYHCVVLYRSPTAGWIEISRGEWTLESLVGTGVVLPYAIGPCYYAGTVSDNQETWNYVATQPFKLTGIRGYAKTAPSGGSCVIDALKNGASVFASQSNAINIQDGTNEDASDGIDVDFAVGDRLTYKVISANAAADVTIAAEAYTDAISP